MHMTDPRVTNLAKTIVHYSTRVKPGDRVAIRGFPLTPAAAPLINAVMREVLLAGGHPYPLIELDEWRELVLKNSSEQQLGYIHPWLNMITDDFDVDIRISSPANTRALSMTDPARLNLVRAAQKPMLDTWFARTGSGALRWVVSRFPTNALAQEAEMSLQEYEDFFYASCYAQTEDAVKHWEAMTSRLDKLAAWLNGFHELHLHGPDIDLRLNISGRTFIGSSGKHNLPDGEIYTGPVEDSAQGWVRFSYPCIYNSIEVEGVELHFEAGRVVKAQAAKHEAYLQATLDADDGARYLGELGIGMNEQIQRFTRSMLFDEKLAGTIHLALGGGYPETGSSNQSAIHWDMLVDMHHDSEITADGELIYRDGAFLSTG
jgi:aminopeptidase